MISSYKDATCLVTISEGKFFSLGINLDYLLSVSGNEMTQIMADLQRLYCRLLTFPMVTVAAANGMIPHTPYHRRLPLSTALCSYRHVFSHLRRSYLCWWSPPWFLS